MRYGNHSWGSIFAATIVSGQGGWLGIIMIAGFLSLFVGMTIGCFVDYNFMRDVVVPLSGYNWWASFAVAAILGNMVSGLKSNWPVILVGLYFLVSMIAPVILFIAMIHAGVIAEEAHR